MPGLGPGIHDFLLAVDGRDQPGHDGWKLNMAAYGLYTHIQSNKRRSIALLIGLFVLVYVLVFAGALLAEALTVDAPLDYLLRAAEFDFIKALPFATAGAIVWIVDRLPVPPVDDRRGDRRHAGDPPSKSRGSTISWRISASRAASRCRRCASPTTTRSTPSPPA